MTEGSSQTGQVRWQLVLVDGPKRVGQNFPVTGDILTLGRELDNDVALDDMHVSKLHARLTQYGNRLVVEDLDSINGTLVNDAPVTKPQVLQPNDLITLGSFTFRVEEIAAAIPQSRLQTRAYPLPKSEARSGRALWLAVAGAALLVIIIIMLIGGYWLTFGRRSSPVETPTPATPGRDLPAIVINQAPAEETELDLNQSITIQATASDPAGITRMALWVNGQQVDQVASQLAQNVPSMTAAFQWSVDRPGVYNLEIRATNQTGLTNTLPVVTVTVVDQSTPVAPPVNTPTITPLPLPPTPTPIPSPSPTFTPTPVPETPTPQPASLTVNTAGLNVRAGPGTQYPPVGLLQQGDQAEIVGQANVGQGRWWQIRFGPAPDGLGWVSADPVFSTAVNTADVPVVEAPASAASPATATVTPVSTPDSTVLRAPAGKTLLLVSNRSLINQPARLTLSGGKSVGGGREIDVDPNSPVQLVLEPDFYRALWSSPYRSFVRGVDFTAVPGKVRVMWIVPEDGLTGFDQYDELVLDRAVSP